MTSGRKRHTAVVTVTCEGAVHTLTVTNLGVEYADHDRDSVAVFLALGGTPLPCVAAKRVIGKLRAAVPNVLERAAWFQAGVSTSGDVRSWQKSGFGPAGAADWVRLGVSDAVQARRWADCGLVSAEVAGWVRLGYTDPAAPLAWSAKGIDAVGAAALRQVRVTKLRNALGWQALGVRAERIPRMRAIGVVDAEAGCWARAGVRTPRSVKAWLAAGAMGGADVLEWTRAGIRTPAGVRRWRLAGASGGAEARAWRSSGVSTPGELRTWRAHGVDNGGQRRKWSQIGVESLADLDEWRIAGMDDAGAAFAYFAVGVCAPKDIAAFVDAGVSDAAEAVKWARIGVGSLDELMAWRALGLDAAGAYRWLSDTESHTVAEGAAWIDATGGSQDDARERTRTDNQPDTVKALRTAWMERSDPAPSGMAMPDGRDAVRIDHDPALPNGAVATAGLYYSLGRSCQPAQATHVNLYQLDAAGDILAGTQMTLPATTGERWLGRLTGCDRSSLVQLAAADLGGGWTLDRLRDYWHGPVIELLDPSAWVIAGPTGSGATTAATVVVSFGGSLLVKAAETGSWHHGIGDDGTGQIISLVEFGPHLERAAWEL